MNLLPYRLRTGENSFKSERKIKCHFLMWICCIRFTNIKFRLSRSSSVACYLPVDIMEWGNISIFWRWWWWFKDERISSSDVQTSRKTSTLKLKLLLWFLFVLLPSKHLLNEAVEHDQAQVQVGDFYLFQLLFCLLVCLVSSQNNDSISSTQQRTKGALSLLFLH